MSFTALHPALSNAASDNSWSDPMAKRAFKSHRQIQAPRPPQTLAPIQIALYRAAAGNTRGALLEHGAGALSIEHFTTATMTRSSCSEW
jgi:hypothetical protein